MLSLRCFMAGLLPLIFCVFILLIPVLKVFLQAEKSKRKLNLPPSPPRLPILGNIHQLGKMPHLSLTRLAKKIGPIMFLQLGEISTVIVSSASMAKEVLKTHDLVFCSRPELYSAKCLFYDRTDIAFAPYDAHWRHLRKLCVLELLNTKRVQSYNYVRKEEVSRLVHSIAQCYPGPVNLSNVLGLYTKNIMCQIVLGRNFSDQGEYNALMFHSMLEELQALAGGFNIEEFFPSIKFLHQLTGYKSRLEKAFRRFDDFFNGVIKEHLNSQGDKTRDKDVLDVLLNTQKDESGDMSLTMNNVKATLLDIFVAGIGTTFTALDWAMIELIINPTVMQQAQAEVRSIVGGRKIVLESDLPQLHYIRAIVKETLRLHPPGPLGLPRESLDGVTLDGYDIPTRTRVFVNIWAIARDRKSWIDPETFNPNRFIDNKIDYKGQDFELLPFGAGRRICPGMTFAAVTIELAIAQLLHSFEWELPYGVEAKDLDLSDAFGLSLQKISDTIVVAKPHFV
ncbi:hypothetical protein Ancab_035791 [Ancistrocladus abbreviatus]